MTSFGGYLRRIADRLVPAPRATGGPAILMYHRIAEEIFDPWGLAVPAGAFADQVRWLATNRSVIALAEFARLHRRGDLPGDAVAITFDDGYASVMEQAAPVLETFGAPATVFIPADIVDGCREFWWDELERIVLDHAGQTLELNGTVTLGERSARDGRWDPGADPETSRQHAYLAIWRRLKTLGPEALGEAMASLRQQAAMTDAPRSSRPLLTAEQLRERPALLDVGSHALTHPSLPSLARPEKEREIRYSIARCEALSGTSPKAFAYPFGDIDRESVNLVQAAGFECACTAQHSFVGPRTGPFTMPRLAVPNCDAAGLASLLGTS